MGLSLPGGGLFLGAGLQLVGVVRLGALGRR
jgi:hypothetical protein